MACPRRGCCPKGQNVPRSDLYKLNPSTSCQNCVYMRAESGEQDSGAVQRAKPIREGADSVGDHFRPLRGMQVRDGHQRHAAAAAAQGSRLTASTMLLSPIPHMPLLSFNHPMADLGWKNTFRNDRKYHGADVLLVERGPKDGKFEGQSCLHKNLSGIEATGC